MLTIPGYEIQEKIYSSSNSLVYRGYRQEDKQPIIIKMSQEVYPHPEKVAHYQQEYEILSKLNLAGVVKVYEVMTTCDRPYIILEDFGGISLSLLKIAGKLSLPQFLQLAIKITEIIETIHQEKIIHKDLNPSNIVMNQQTQEVKIIDFGIATILEQETQAFTNLKVLEGTLAYISPEQTGRMNRFIDYRSDFYALGVTFYELLTGKLPFYSDSNDYLQLVHCHIAQKVTPPYLVADRIYTNTQEQHNFKIVSEIITKLLAKNAEDRYQSAHGLKYDLQQCYQQIIQNTNQIISDFELATQDFTPQLQISQKLYGREADLEQLLKAFNLVTDTSSLSANQKPTKLVLVSGYSGIGKSALVREIYKPITRQNGLFIAGKYDQYHKDRPYNAFTQAFNEFCNYLLTESEDILANWRSQINLAVGDNGQVLVDLIPNLELVIGKQQDIPQLNGIEAQRRFNLVFQNFIEAICNPEHPLVMFLDDLQWMDAASLNLLDLLITNPTLSHCLIIGAYRDNEVDNSHPLMAILETSKQQQNLIELHLTNLTGEQVTTLIADSLSCAVSECQDLANLVYSKTQGNAFFTIEFLRSLYRQGLLYFNYSASKTKSKQGQWCWHLEAIEHCNITDNVVDLMVDKINSLNTFSQNLLKIASCVGNTFDLATLAIFYEQEFDKLKADLLPLLTTRLVIPLNQNYQLLDTADYHQAKRIKFQFLHDRVQQAAYSLLDTKHQQITHFQIGKLLYSKLPKSELDDIIFDIVNHLNYGISFIKQPADLFKLAKLNLIAGKKAKKGTAFAAALQYLETSLSCMVGNHWQDNYEFSFSLYQELAEVQYLTGNHQQSQETINILLNKARSLKHKIKAFSLLKNLQATQGKDYIQVLQVGLQLLKQCDLDFPEDIDQQQKAITTQLQAINLKLIANSVSNLINLPVVKDIQAKLKMELCMEFYEAAFYNGISNLILLTALNLVNLSLKYGNTNESSFGYVLYGMYLVEQNDYQQGYDFGNLALKVIEKFNDSVMLPKVRNLFCNYINYHLNSFSINANYYRQNIQISRENGEIVFGVWAAVFYIWSLFLSSVPLDKVYQESQKYWDFVQQTNDFKMIKVLQLLQLVILNLQGKMPAKCFLKKDEINSQEFVEFWQKHDFINGVTWYAILYCQILYTYGYYQAAFKIVQKYAQELAPNIIMFPISQYYIYYPLTLTSLYPCVTKDEQKKFIVIIEDSLQKLKLWQQYCPHNFKQQYLLLQAEYARIKGQKIVAMKLYDQAITIAHHHQLIQQEALANELAGKFWLTQKKPEFAKLYLNKAYYQYQRWGAEGKVQDLTEKYTSLLTELALSRANTNSSIIKTTKSSGTQNLGLDLTSILQVSQTLVSEIKLEKLLAKIMKIVIENAGAELGYLVLKNHQQWTIQVSGKIGKKEVKVDLSLDVDGQLKKQSNSILTYLPHTIINYVARTHQAVVLDDAHEANNFQNDPYIQKKQPKSVLCLPLIHQGELLGLLYLENNLIRGAFTEDRLEIVKIIATQAAISLENAQLYNQLEIYSKTLETKVQQRTKELEIAKEAADAANRAKSEFLSNMSHELRTPLNAILGFTQIMSRDHSMSVEQRENLDIINRSGEHLLALINDILDLSKIDAGSITINNSSFDLYNLLNTLEQMLRVKTSSKNLELIFDLSPNLPQYIQTDANKLRQILINLLSNAIKFTLKGGVTLRASFDSNQLSVISNQFDSSLQYGEMEGVINFEVEDTGVGIAPEDLEHIFDPFVQTKIGQTFSEGTGLGLAISRKFVELMGGKLQVSSQLNQGTIVHFCLPIQLAKSEEVDIKNVPKKIISIDSEQQYKIIIAEDREANRQLLVKLLIPLGFLVKEANNGQEAITLWENWSPHLILMDMRMPVMDGYEATKYIKQHLKGQATVIIALTASAFSSEKAIVLSAGCDDFLGKPFREDILLEKIANHLGFSYLYEEVNPACELLPSNQNQSLTSEDLKVMSSDWIKELYEAANQADSELLLELLEQIPLEHQKLAIALQNLINNFRYDYIIDLTQIEGNL